MTIDLTTTRLLISTSEADEVVPGGIASFPTLACARPNVICLSCFDCCNDCADCELCSWGGCEVCAPPDLTPRTAKMLSLASQQLATEVRDLVRHYARPVYLQSIAEIFERQGQLLESGRRPWPGAPAEQLCIFLAIRHARELACETGESVVGDMPISNYDYDFDRLYDTLLPDNDHQALVEAVGRSARSHAFFDFSTLADLLSPLAVNRLFQPFGADDSLVRWDLPSIHR